MTAHHKDRLYAYRDEIINADGDTVATLSDKARATDVIHMSAAREMYATLKAISDNPSFGLLGVENCRAALVALGVAQGDGRGSSAVFARIDEDRRKAG